MKLGCIELPKGIKISTVLLGIYLNLACIATYLFPNSAGGTDSGGSLGLLYIVVLFLLLVTNVVNNTIFGGRINKGIWVTIIGVLAFYFYSISVYPEPRTPFNHFVVFFVFGMLLPSITKINTRLLLLTVIYTTLPAVFVIRTVFFSTAFSSSVDVMSQGYSYAFLPPAVCTILYIKYFLKYDYNYRKILNIICILFNILFAILLVFRGSRGPVMAIILLMAIFYLFDIHINMVGIRVRKKKMIFWGMCIYLVVQFFIPILIILQESLLQLDISIQFIDKFIIRETAGDISSERRELFDMAISGFMNSPLFGNGFDQFMNNTGRGYPHNFIAQILYDGGIYLFSITLLPVLIQMKKWFGNCNYDEYIIILLLFFVSVPGGLVSHDLWEQGNLWLFFGAICNYRYLVY